VSQAIKDYAYKHVKLDTTFLVHHPWTYLKYASHKIPKQRFNWNKKLIAMINPCPMKGSTILFSLANRFPKFNFAVWRSWGHNDKVKEELMKFRNIE